MDLRRVVIWAVGFAVVLSACGGAVEAISAEPRMIRATSQVDEGEPQSGGVLRLGNRDYPPAGFDPMRTSSIALHHVAGAIFGPGNLVKRCRANFYLVCPYLATSWSHNQDFTEWSFNIRSRVYWHDGTPFTAEDVRFWFELAYFGVTVDGKTRPPAYFRGNMGEIVDVTADHGRVTVTLAEPTVRFPEMLTDPRMKIAHPAHLMQPLIDSGEVGVSPLDVGLVGLGPFRVEKVDPGVRVRVGRFQRYWERDARGKSLPYLDGIDFIVTPDPAVMDLAIRTDRLDGGARGEGHYLTAERLEVYVRAMGDEVQLTEIAGGFFRLAFNMLRPGPWQDVRVRRAISLWIDSDAGVVGALGGMGFTSIRDFPAAGLDRHPFILWPPFDPSELEASRTEAKRLMEEAGYGNGFSMTYLCRAVHLERCEFLRDQLAGLNIDLELDIVDEAGWGRARVSLDHDSQSGAGFSSPVPEATEAVYGRFSANRDAYARHEDTAIDRLYLRLRQATGVPLRVAIWQELSEYMVDTQVYVIPIAGTIQVVPYHHRVKGLVVPPEDGHTHTDFATVWLDEG